MSGISQRDAEELRIYLAHQMNGVFTDEYQYKNVLGTVKSMST
jgi:hypothetical protein